MTYLETAINSIRRFPALYISGGEISVLSQLFLVSGNGCEWLDGELSEKIQSNGKCRVDIKTAKTILLERGLTLIPFHLAMYAGIVEFPADIKPDWTAAMFRMIEFFENISLANLKTLINASKVLGHYDGLKGTSAAYAKRRELFADLRDRLENHVKFRGKHFAAKIQEEEAMFRVQLLLD